MCSYALASIAYPWGDDVGAMKIEMDVVLNCLGHGAVKVVWGGIAPASALVPGDTSGWNAALVMVAHKLETQKYIVIVRGTNPLSWDSWKLEDFDVCKKRAWNDADASEGEISNATHRALSIHSGLSDGGVALLPFLQGIVARDPAATISFTGHSLGGCMAPVLALKFAEIADIQRSRLSVYAYAGPTPGDAVFASYMTSFFAGSKGFAGFDTVSFVRDSADVVPHAWNDGDLEKVKSLYPDCPATAAVLKLIEYVQGLVAEDDYQQAFPGFIPILSELELIADVAPLLSPDYLAALAKDSESLQIGAWLQRELPRIGALTQEQLASGAFDTLSWFFCAMLMHVLPYLALCLPGAQSVLFEKVLAPCYFKGRLALPALR
jgi:Lipase (class 3).